jgi:citrate lyase subunit beta/citryl-CoA lyase
MGCQDYPLRSVLYVPGDNIRALEKVSSLDMDAVILDLEDGVAPKAKAAARNNIRKFLAAPPKGLYLTVRVNGVDGDLICDDFRAFKDFSLNAFVLPKVEKPEDITRTREKISAFGYRPDVKIWAMIETPLGVLNVNAIAESEKELECLVIGTNDLVKDLHARHTPEREPILYSLSCCILAARAYGLSVIDGVHIDIKDSQGFKASCRQGAEMGFDGKTVIHPAQIEGANDAYAPSEKELEEARKIVLSFEEATAQGKGVTLVDGKLVEALHVENAQRLLALAEKIKS